MNRFIISFISILTFCATHSFSQEYFSPNPLVSIETANIKSFLSQIPEIGTKAKYYNISKPVLQTILVLQSNAGKSTADGMYNYGRVISNHFLTKYDAFAVSINGFVICSKRSQGIEAVTLSLHFLRKKKRKVSTDAEWLTLIFGPKGDLARLASEGNGIYQALTGKSFGDLGLAFGKMIPAKELVPSPEVVRKETEASKELSISEVRTSNPEEKPGSTTKPAQTKPMEDEGMTDTAPIVPPDPVIQLAVPSTEPQPSNPVAQVEGKTVPQEHSPFQESITDSRLQPSSSIKQGLQDNPLSAKSASAVPVVLQKTTSQRVEQNADYGRSSFTIVQAIDPDRSKLNFRNTYGSKSSFSNRFDWNNTPSLYVRLDPSSAGYSNKITEQINKSGIGRELLAYWFERKPDGSFGTNLIAKRGLYNASDLEKRLSESSPRDVAEIQDAGFNLINKSYVMLVNVSSFQTMEQYYNDQDAARREYVRKNPGKKFEPVSRTRRGYRGTVTGYLFKLDYNDTVQQALYDIWVDKDDTPEQRKEKVAAFENLSVPLVFIGQFNPSFPIEASEKKEKQKGAGTDGKEIDILTVLANSLKAKPLTDQKLLRMFAEEAREKLLKKIVKTSRIKESLQISAPLFKTDPLQAKIGLKEGVCPEKRFFVFEKEEKANGKYVYRRKGIIRAKSSVTDNTRNTNADTKPTGFFRVGGLGKLEEGMLVREKPEIGFAISALYAPGFGGNDVRDMGLSVEMNLSLIVARVMGRGVPTGFKLGAGGTGESVDPILKNRNVKFNRLWIYIRKDWPVGGAFRFALFTGYAHDTSSNIDDEDEILFSASFIPTGSEFGLNLAPWLHAFAQAEYDFSLGDATHNNKQHTPTGHGWYDFFPNRKGITNRVGLRISF